MQAVVIYESMFGNTRVIAYAIGAGLADYFDVAVIPVGRAYPTSYNQADLVVVGGPTHVHGLSRPSTRQAAAKQADAGDAMSLEPDALGEGLREWLASQVTSRGHGLAAAFDTRMPGPAIMTGRASKRISNALRRQGYELVTKPESFLVSKANVLRSGERDRARSWGAALAESLSLTPESSRSG
ncbi:MAG TPA: flavodoxin [Streptosporangiaceae bacterium]